MKMPPLGARISIDQNSRRIIFFAILSVPYCDSEKDLRLLDLAELQAALRVQLAPDDVPRFMEAVEDGGTR